MTGTNNYPNKLYHYTSFKNFISIWDSKKLKFSSYKNVNDMLERSKLIIGYSPEPLKYLYDCIARYNQISFCKDFTDDELKGYESPVMWGLYGNKGVCIEIDLDRLTIPEVVISGDIEYKPWKEIVPNKLDPMITNLKDIESYVENNIHSLFFTKHKHWSFENEYRMISQQRFTEKNKPVEDYLDISKAISAIYIHNVSEAERHTIEKLTEGQVDVYLYNIAAMPCPPDMPPRKKKNLINLAEYKMLLNRLRTDPGYYTDPKRIRERFPDLELFTVDKTISINKK